MKKGEIYLVPYPYSDFKTSKVRPALVLISFATDVTVCYITSQISSLTTTDVVIPPSTINGLSLASLVKTGKMVTILKANAISYLGKLSGSEMQLLDKNLKSILQLQ